MRIVRQRRDHGSTLHLAVDRRFGSATWVRKLSAVRRDRESIVRFETDRLRKGVWSPPLVSPVRCPASRSYGSTVGADDTSAIRVHRKRSYKRNNVAATAEAPKYEATV